ncbi:hypothetical protein E2320_012189, partial [Naja naja]
MFLLVELVSQNNQFPRNPGLEPRFTMNLNRSSSTIDSRNGIPQTVRKFPNLHCSSPAFFFHPKTSGRPPFFDCVAFNFRRTSCTFFPQRP